MKKIISLCLFVSLFFITPITNAQTETDESRPFHQTENAMADIDATLATAKAENKLALIVLGANWCHDSRGLAQRLGTEEMSSLMVDKYELLYVDIGFYETNMGIVSRFGLPILFGTPTVLVIDPETEQLLNRDSMHKWLDAASVSLEDTKDHFTKLLNAKPIELNVEQSDRLKTLLAEISAYEAEQTERITKGYAVIGPLLEARVSGEGEDDTFMNYWQQLGKMRYGLANSLIELRSQAIRRDQAGEQNIELVFPEYPAFTWE